MSSPNMSPLSKTTKQSPQLPEGKPSFDGASSSTDQLERESASQSVQSTSQSISPPPKKMKRSLSSHAAELASKAMPPPQSPAKQSFSSKVVKKPLSVKVPREKEARQDSSSKGAKTTLRTKTYLESLKEYFETEDWPSIMLCSQDGGMFAVHEGLICLWSEALADLIRSEERNPKTPIILQGHKGDVVRAAVDFFYTGDYEYHSKTNDAQAVKSEIPDAIDFHIRVFYLADYTTAASLEVLSARKFVKALSPEHTQLRRIHDHLLRTRHGANPEIPTQNRTLLEALIEECASRMAKLMDTKKVPLPLAFELHRPWIHHGLMSNFLQHLGCKLGIQFENHLACPRCRKAMPLTSGSESNNFLCSGANCRSEPGVPVELVK